VLPVVLRQGHALSLRRTRDVCGLMLRRERVAPGGAVATQFGCGELVERRAADGVRVVRLPWATLYTRERVDELGFCSAPADALARALEEQAPWLEAERRAPREDAVIRVRRWGLSVGRTTSLMRAAYAGDEQGVRELLAAGAPLLCADGSGRWTALHWASHRGDARIVAALLEADAEGATVDARDDGGATPLILASALGHEGAVRALLARGARQELQNRVGRSAMHKAAEFAAAGVIAQLCVAPGAAAALALREQYGYTPHKVAVDKGHALCAELLRVHGAL